MILKTLAAVGCALFSLFFKGSLSLTKTIPYTDVPFHVIFFHTMLLSRDLL